MAAMVDGANIDKWRLDEASYRALCDEMFETRKARGMPYLFRGPEGELLPLDRPDYREGLLLMGIPVYSYGNWKTENSTHGD